MSNAALTWAWSIERKSLAEKLVLLCLADKAGFKHDCYPNLASLVRHTGVSRRGVIMAIDALERDGLIRRERRTRDNGSQTSNLYLLNVVYGEGAASAPGGALSSTGGVHSATPLIDEPSYEPKNKSGLKKRDVTPTARPALAEISQDDRRVPHLRRERAKLIPTTRFTYLVDPARLEAITA